MATRVNGGIINDQSLAGSLRFFKMTGPFAWTVSDGTVNLPPSTGGGDPTTTTYFAVGDQRPVPLSAAELAFREITKNADVSVISLVPGPYAATNAIHFACSATGFGWGADNESDPAAAAADMQAAVQALGALTVYTTVGAKDSKRTPVTTTANMASVAITEVQFKLA